MHQFARLSALKRPLLLLAPLAALGHRGLRELITEFGGCDLFFSEMISAEALLSGSNYESYYLDAGPASDRVVYQLVGAETASLTKAAAVLLSHAALVESTTGLSGCAGIDLNMGCSAPEMVKQGAGVHWMTLPDEARRLVASLRSLVPTDKSLSAKIRIGEEADFPALAGFCRGLQDEGLDFITFHPRLRKDPWSRPARWAWFRQLADELSIPLVANGDIRTPQSLDDLAGAWRGAGATAATGDWPAGMMIGRAAVKTPWIFAQLARAMAAAGPTRQPTVDLLAVAERFHQLLETWQPQDFWLTRAKRWHAYFGQNLAFGHRVAANIQNINEYPKILPFFAAYLAENPGERWLGATGGPSPVASDL